MSYSPQKIFNQSQKVTEVKNEEIEIKKTEDEILDQLIKDLSTPEKVRFLLEEGWNSDLIKKKIGLSSGELELFLNIENTKNI